MELIRREAPHRSRRPARWWCWPRWPPRCAERPGPAALLRPGAADRARQRRGGPRARVGVQPRRADRAAQPQAAAPARRAAWRSGPHRSARGPALLDLDRFKEVNDTLASDRGSSCCGCGHPAGLRGRGEDTVARLGGRTSSRCCCPGWPTRTRRWRWRSGWPTPSRIPSRCTGSPSDLECSIGVAPIRTTRGFESLAAARGRGDVPGQEVRSVVAKYEAGRDLTPRTARPARRPAPRPGGGRGAAALPAEGGLATGQVVGFEGLVRWHHATRGAVNPRSSSSWPSRPADAEADRVRARPGLAQTARWWRSGWPCGGRERLDARYHWPGFVNVIQQGLLKHGVPPPPSNWRSPSECCWRPRSAPRHPRAV